MELAGALASGGEEDTPHLLAPVDLQPIKAAEVTLVQSMIERVIEEATGGDATIAARARDRILGAIGEDVERLRPGTPKALHFRSAMLAEGRRSPCLEVGLGPDGVARCLGTMFAPTRDRPRTDGRIVPGDGFTHRFGDRVRISSPHLGSLENTVRTVNECPRRTMGLADLF